MTTQTSPRWTDAQAACGREMYSSTWQDVLATLGGAASGIVASLVFVAAYKPAPDPLVAVPAVLILAAAVSLIAAVSSRYRKRRQALVAQETSRRIAKLIAEQAPEASSPEGAAKGAAKVKSKLRSLRQAS
ncbi:hypothetical protein PNH50_16310 [Leisingera aquaemixtae]|jgi:VIT1/CCC1 family predicted Fe2+/Mn2+ transporter|uniref:Uncharacterized protein n=1 Tax=Leisingera aquaemixtae TaxID=1396826 RepID=A0A0P1HPD9_9RHOB|nr:MULTISPECIES: hypothetical protein [Leisingera]QDI77824.1 hypothetical protein R2C4_19460 [Leisingera aquaemixtae]UWQ24478.1 hypothetical protein K3553_16235 [Leisingera aquaemixtae]UWQ41113.1 hypothetical protein K3718_16510 [Leisingera aquaemixtae]UWQ45371.1 hypothetical protein K3719_16620 [Leisingera aquaemixtae]CUH99247.1 hypothetical protein PHA8399_01363 [Leisingera aquaemixtae]